MQLRTLLLIVALVGACEAPRHRPPRLDDLGYQIIIFPEDHGAFPDDGLDDRLGAQAAVDEACERGGGVVLFDEGIWDFPTRSPPGTYNRFAVLSWHCHGVSVSGVDEFSTTFQVSGDQGGTTTWVIALDPGASDSASRYLTIDTSQTFNTGEQFHALNIGSNVCADAFCSGDVKNITVEHMRFVHPAPEDGSRKGDCVHTFGEPEHAAHNVKIIDSTFESCARSAIGMQRNSNFVTISRNFFDGDKMGASPVDGEATGGGWQTGLIYTENTSYRRRPIPLGIDDYALALTSQERAIVTNNIFLGRGINAFRLVDSTISNNVIDAYGVPAGPALIDLGNMLERVGVRDNQLKRDGQPGALIKIRPASSGFADSIVIADNIGDNRSDGPCIHVDSGRLMNITGNICRAAGLNSSMGVYLAAGSRASEGITVSNNVIESAKHSGIRFDPGPFQFGSVLVTGNVTRIGGPGLRCDDPTLWTPGAITVGVNSFSTSMICAAADQ